MSKLKFKKIPEKIKTLVYLILLIQGIIYICFSFTLSLKISYSNASNGSIQLFYTDSQYEDKALMNYDTSTQWKDIIKNEKSLLFKDITISIDNLRVDIDGTNKISISEITVYFKGIMIAKLEASTLQSLITVNNLDYILNNENLNFQCTGEDAYFTISSYKFFTYALWFIFNIITLLISTGISLIVYRKIIKQKYINIELPLIVAPLYMSFFIELINGNYWFISMEYKLINFFFLYMMCKFIYMGCYNITFETLLFNIVETVWAVANYFVIQFRGKPILPTDIVAVNTALSVASGYSYYITIPMVITITFTILYTFLTIGTEQNKVKHSSYFLIQLVIITILGISIIQSNSFSEMETLFWDSDIKYCYKIQGSVASFIKYSAALKVRVPKGYSHSELERIWESVENESNSKNNKNPVAQNIIMVMNESFSDLRVLGNKYEEDVIPFYESLTKNTIKGDLYVSVRGGGTCNTEFEALTGTSMIFFPPGSYPFESYINREIDSLASYLRKKEYVTSGIHLENPNNWNRKKVYPNLGLEHFYSLQDFTDLELITGRASDSSNYDCVLDIIKQNMNQKQFIFDVTIQNHGGYTDSLNMPVTFDLSNYGSFEDAAIFFSLMKISDNAFKELVEYFSNIETPTMIILFGDHQPTLSLNTEAWLYNNTTQNTEINNLNKYITPFIIWTNYDIKEQFIEKISANFLPSIILETANLELPAYYRFLKEVYKVFPVITTQGIIDSNGNYYSDINSVPDNSILLDYEYLQYNNIFDKNKVKKTFD